MGWTAGAKSHLLVVYGKEIYDFILTAVEIGELMQGRDMISPRCGCRMSCRQTRVAVGRQGRKPVKRLVDR